MIGLEYIVNLYGKQFKDVAEELLISKQVVNGWIKGRYKISKKHIPKLSEMFKIPEEYFQKDVDEIDKLKIQQIKHENEFIGFEDTYIDRETGEEVAFWYEDSNDERYRNLLKYEIKVKELHKNLQQTIDDEQESDDEYIHPDKLQEEAEELVDVYTELVNVIQKGILDKDTLKRIIIGIKMYKEGKEVADELSKDICSALIEDNERIAQKSIEYEEDWGSL